MQISIRYVRFDRHVMESQLDRSSQPSRLTFGASRAAFSFFERRIVTPPGGFYDLYDEGQPTAPGYAKCTRVIHRHRAAEPGLKSTVAISYTNQQLQSPLRTIGRDALITLGSIRC